LRFNTDILHRAYRNEISENVHGGMDEERGELYLAIFNALK
jgi:hypothetical protein